MGDSEDAGGLRLIAAHLAKVKLAAAEQEFSMRTRISALERQLAAAGAKLEEAQSDAASFQRQVKQLQAQNTYKALVQEREKWKSLIDTLRSDNRGLRARVATLEQQHQNENENQHQDQNKNRNHTQQVQNPEQPQVESQYQQQGTVLHVSTHQAQDCDGVEKKRSGDPRDTKVEETVPGNAESVSEMSKKYPSQPEGDKKLNKDGNTASGSSLNADSPRQFGGAIAEEPNEGRAVEAMRYAIRRTPSQGSEKLLVRTLSNTSAYSHSSVASAQGGAGCAWMGASPINARDAVAMRNAAITGSPSGGIGLLDGRIRKDSLFDSTSEVLQLKSEISFLKHELETKSVEINALRAKLDRELELKWERDHRGGGGWQRSLFESFAEVLAPYPHDEQPVEDPQPEHYDDAHRSLSSPSKRIPGLPPSLNHPNVVESASF